MPIYEYLCEKCDHEFEREQRITDAPVKTCPSCRSRRVKKLISQSSFVLKGGGWYNDLYSSSKPDAKDGKSDAKDDKSDAKDGKSDAKDDKSGKSETSSDKPKSSDKKKDSKKGSGKGSGKTSGKSAA